MATQPARPKGQVARSNVRIQLAIQGGGARLAALLPAIEVIQDYERRGVIEITRVAGSSAGAIAAAIIAGGVSAADLKERFEQQPPAYWEGIFPPPSLWRATWRVLRHKAVFELDALRELLRKKIFDPADDRTIESPRPESARPAPQLFVVVANLNSGRMEARSSGGLIDALLDSCAVPFVFRGVSSGSAYIDGGLLANLPSEVLSEGNSMEYGPILGLAFKDRPFEPPRALFPYIYRLLEAPLFHSVARAKKQLGAALHEIKTDLRMLDFGAIPKSLRREYEATKVQTEHWLAGLIPRLQAGQRVDLWAGAAPSLLQELSQLCDKLDAGAQVRLMKRSVVIEAHSLRIGAARGGEPDRVIDVKTFMTGDRPYQCDKVAISAPTESKLDPRCVCAVSDSDGKSVPFSLLPAAGPVDRDEIRREVLVFFTPALPPESGPYTIRLEDRAFDAMRPLRESGRDASSILSRKSATPYQAELIMVVPESFGCIRQEPEKDDPRGRVVEGHEMEPDDIRAAFRRMGYSEPTGWSSYGWTAQMSAEDDCLAVRYLRE